MKVNHFDPPGNIDDFGTDQGIKDAWSASMSGMFDIGALSVASYLSGHGGGTAQFYNPLTNPRTEPDLPQAATNIPWNGFPKRYSAAGPGQPARYVEAEAPIAAGEVRDQDEYLEWFVNRRNGKIVSIHFTCEAWDYFQFLADHNPAKVLKLYQTWISPNVTQDDLFPGGEYDVRNKWNTELGAMHLTHPANNLYAEVFLAATATVRRAQNGAEITASLPLIRCGGYGDDTRNSDPAIGAAVNGLARAGRHVTLANPVGLYMASFNGDGLTVDGQPAGGFFEVVRGAFPLALRAVYKLPAALEEQGLTVSDVKIGATPLRYGGQLAERITMRIRGVASVAQDIRNAPVTVCGAVPSRQPPAPPPMPMTSLDQRRGA